MGTILIETEDTVAWPAEHAEDSRGLQGHVKQFVISQPNPV